MFSDSFLHALSNWQNGWKENQDRKRQLEDALLTTITRLPLEFKVVDVPCYRKRFIHKGELLDILFKDHKSEGLASWTTDLRYAERFKELVREDAVSGVIFEHLPESHEVIVNINALWKSDEFKEKVNQLHLKDPNSVKALIHFKDSQGEVILNSPLRGTEVKYFTGVSSPFDELCDTEGIPEDQRDRIFMQLIESGVKIQEPQYTPDGSAQGTIARTMEKFHQKLLAIKADQTIDGT